MYQLFGIALVLASVLHVFQVARRPISKIPGPWYSKYTGLALWYHWVKGQRSQYVHELHRRYGRAVRLAPNEVDFCDITAQKQIYTTKETFPKSEWYRALTANPIASVFDATDVEYHRRHRRPLSAAMSESALRAGAAAVVKERAERTIGRMKEEMGKRGAVDVFKWWLFMATDIIGELTFGESFQLLEQGKKNGYIEDLEKSAPLDAIRAMVPSLSIVARLLPLPVFRQALRSAQATQQYADESIARYERLALSDPTRVQHGLFTRIFRAEEEHTLDRNEIRTNARAYIIAGSDTTSNTLTYLVWAVCRHPAVKVRLVEELKTLPAGFGDAELKSLVYLSQVIDETLRLYAAAPSGLPRIVPQGGAAVGEGKWWVAGGTTVNVQAYSMHRDAEVYPDPEAFKPERWEAPSKVMKDAFVAFGGGARVCLGVHLAKMELRYATARFFQEFPGAMVSTAEGMVDEDMTPNIYFLLSPKGRRCLINVSEE